MIKSISYLRELFQWWIAGKPIRSQEQVDKIFATCQACPMFSDYKDQTGTCGICGCYIKKDTSDIKFNKASWGTTKCPDKPPRW